MVTSANPADSSLGLKRQREGTDSSRRRRTASLTNDTFFVLTDWDLAIDPSAVQFELEERDTLWPEIAPLGLDRIRFVGVRIGQNANLPSSPPSLLTSFHRHSSSCTCGPRWRSIRC